MVKFTVPTIPVAQPRQRHRLVRTGKASFVQNYTPAKSPVNTYKAAVQYAARQAYDGPPLDGPLRVDLCFVFPRPKNLIWKTKPMSRLWHTKKPDRDNLAKSTYDALNGLLWRDDAQVCTGTVEKLIAAGSEQPCVQVVVSKASLHRSD